MFTVTGEAKSYFVRPKNGTDADGGGAREHPWRTLQFAVDRALPGDRVVLLPGFYAGEAKLTHGGLKGAPITIEADQPGTVVLDGRQESQACLRLERAPDVVIRGLEVRWFAHSGIYVADSPDVSVLDCRIWNGTLQGWLLGSAIFVHRSPGLVADHNVMFQLEQGIMLLVSPRARMTFNTSLINSFGAILVYDSGENTVCKNNSFAYSGNVQYAGSGDLKTFDCDYNNVGTTLYEDHAVYGIGQQEAFAVKDPFFKSHFSKWLITWDGKMYNGLKAWREATGKDLHSIFKDPMYFDAEHHDFHLQPGSPNIGAGEGGATIGALGMKEK
jgi:hypothetical protein